VHLLVTTVDERKELYAQLQGLELEEIASIKESLCIQAKVMGVKHINTATAHYNLGLTLATTYKPAKTHEAVASLISWDIDIVLTRVFADNDQIPRQWSQDLEWAQTALARFEKPGVLSAYSRTHIS